MFNTKGMVGFVCLLGGCPIDQADKGMNSEDTAGATDADGDGVLLSADCDDADPSIHPGAAELCDGVDQNCSGEADEDESGACPGPVKHLEDSTYFIVMEEHTWEEARDLCYTYPNYHLPTVGSEAENKFLFDALRDYAPDATWSAWLGFNDIASEGNWVWETGDPVTYTYWYASEPENGGDPDEDCTAYISEMWSEEDYWWSDLACNPALYYDDPVGVICETNP